MERDLFDRGLTGEPALRTDLDQVVRHGVTLVRRRRTAAVATVTVTAIAIVLAATLVPRATRDDDSAAPAQIPGCTVVLGPTGTSTSGTSTAGPAAGSSSSSTSSAPRPADPTVPDTAAASTAPAPAPADVAATRVPTTDATPPGPSSMADLSRPPDELTGLLWDRFESWGVSVHARSMLGDLTFHGSGDGTVWASGWARSAVGEGEASVHVARNEQSGAPACRVGALDRRVTYPDGTVVDLSYGSNLAASNLDPVGVQVMSFHAVAYKPDGSLVIASANNSVQIGDEDPDTDTGGIRTTAAPPLTLDQVQDLVTEPVFRMTDPEYVRALPQVRSHVPDVVGLPQQDAVVALQQAGFSVATPGDGASPTIPGQTDPTVVGQSPAGGEAAPRSVSVQLTYGP